MGVAAVADDCVAYPQVQKPVERRRADRIAQVHTGRYKKYVTTDSTHAPTRMVIPSQ